MEKIRRKESIWWGKRERERTPGGGLYHRQGILWGGRANTDQSVSPPPTSHLLKCNWHVNGEERHACKRGRALLGPSASGWGMCTAAILDTWMWGVVCSSTQHHRHSSDRAYGLSELVVCVCMSVCVRSGKKSSQHAEEYKTYYISSIPMHE